MAIGGGTTTERKNIFDVMTMIFSGESEEGSSSETCRSPERKAAEPRTILSSEALVCSSPGLQRATATPETTNEKKKPKVDETKTATGDSRRGGGLTARNMSRKLLARAAVSRKTEEGNGGERKHRNMLAYELEGLEAIVSWLNSLSVNRKCVPKDIPDPDQLLADTMVRQQSTIFDYYY